MIMRKTNTVIVSLFVIFMLSSLSYASGCGTYPSGTLYCLPITFTNSQSTATSTNTQMSITYNALAYQAYEANNLQNMEVYNSISGTIIPAWVEGNVLNEQQTTNLYTSENILIWVKNPDVISASGGSDPNLYIAFFSTSTDEYSSSGNYGAAPQLFCARSC